MLRTMRLVSYLLELFHRELQADQLAYQQLAELETELRDTGMVYKCLPGKHDDLGISCAMLAWAARHPHLNEWFQDASRTRRRWPPQQSYGWAAFT